MRFGFKIPVWAACICAGTLLRAEPTILLQNNQPFPWRMPVRVHLPATNTGPWLTAGGQAVQSLGHDAIFIADAAPSAAQEITLHPGRIGARSALFKIERDGEGVRLSYASRNLGRLSWGVDMHPVTTARGEAVATPDFNSEFKPLPFKFRRKISGPVFDEWAAAATYQGLEIRVELLAYADGFLDINAHLTNSSADAKAKTYAAVVCRWDQPSGVAQTLCYDDRIQSLPAPGHSPFRSGQGRHWFAQRGVDWVRSVFDGGLTAGWLNDFAPSFTVLDNTTNNPFHQPRYAGANLSQLGQEVQTVPGRLYSITEIARSNSKTFGDRLTENVLPARGEGVSFSSRLVFSQNELSDARVDHTFVAFTGYNPQEERPNGAKISFGAPFIRFGTSYFPYSTLGENFDTEKLPGMDREAFWPLAADTVLQWALFAGDIRRDLRIAKAMGFQLIRLHHLELLAAIPGDTRREYLDFLFGELRRLKLRALLDVYASPPQLAELVGRYRDVVDGVELENETLIWGIPLDRPEQWMADYAAVKKVAPEIPVNLTGYNNTGMFNRLTQLGVPFDRIDLHSYIDSLDAIPSGRGYALAMGSFATKIGKPPMISEWNWRGLTKMSEEARAKIYPAIIDNALATRAIPDFYEFQFNETLAPNPRVGRGNILRHYELLNLSRRPKLEAFELMKLIERYSARTDAVRIIQASHEVAELDENNRGKLEITITNTGADLLRLRASVEDFDGLKTELLTNSSLTLPSGQTAVLPIAISEPEPVPGYCHVFVRLESDTGLLRYLWAEVRVTRKPDPGRVTVVYSKTASPLEVETAFALGQVIESATGDVVSIMPFEDVPADSRSNLIVVGSAKDLPPTQSSRLTVTGKDSRTVEAEGMKVILQYWMQARDSAARRVGLARKDLPRGGDAAKLP